MAADGFTERECSKSVVSVSEVVPETPAEPRGERVFQSSGDRMTRLGELAEALLGATTVESVADAILEFGASTLGASCAMLQLLEGDSLVFAGARGVHADTLAPWQKQPLTVPTPMSEALRERTLIFLETAGEWATRFAAAARSPLGPRGARMALPLIVGDRAIGAIGFSFATDRTFSDDDRALARTLSRQCALALDRAHLFEAERRAKVELSQATSRLERVIQAYEHESRMLEAFVRACPAAITLFDLDGTVRMWNPAAERMFGFGAEEVVGGFLPAASPDKRGEVVAHLARIAKGEILKGVETQRRHKLGHMVDVSIYAAPIEHADGTVQCISLAMDIRERKQAEAELRRAYEIAREADRRKDEFLAMLGHELRNPLSPILTALYLMRLKGNAGAERERQVIERQVNHLVSLVDDLLDVSRITRGKIKLDARPMELGLVLGRAIEMASPLLEQKRHKLTVDVPSSGIVASVDETRMAQVLANLLTNAAKYTDHGGHIAVSARGIGDRIVIKVKDDGIGIAPDLLPVVFELFVQGERGADRAGGGLGLGLGLVRSLVALHGGEVNARSEGPGRGSEFEVSLPACAEGPPPRVVLPSPVPAPLRARRVLVVDDNIDAARLLGEVLMENGHDIRVAHDGPQALSLAADFKPEIAILDIGLPVMDGYELAMELRRVFGPSIQLVAVTGYGQEHDKRRAFEAGFSRHYVKPVDAKTLLEEVFG